MQYPKHSYGGKSYLVRAFVDPVIDTDLVEQRKPTIHEFATAVRKEAVEKYRGNIDEAYQVVIDDTRYAIAVVLKDSEDGYLLVTEDTAGFNGLEFSLASNEIFPEASSKVNNVLDDTRIKTMKFIGVARESDNKGGAKKVETLCYEAEIDDELVDNATNNNAKLITVDEIVKLDNAQCSSKVLILKNDLLDKKSGL